ncbi:MAG: hypothetical protein N2C14_15115 [Planctomycetales bacterium]
MDDAGKLVGSYSPHKYQLSAEFQDGKSNKFPFPAFPGWTTHLGEQSTAPVNQGEPVVVSRCKDFPWR